MVSSKQVRSSFSTTKTDTVRRTYPTDPFLSGTSFTCETATREYSLATVTTGPYTQMVGPTSYWYGAGPFGQDLSVSFNALDAKLRAKIKGTTSNLPVSIIEYKQSINLFKSLSEDVWKTFRSLRAGTPFAHFVRLLQSPRTHKEKLLAKRWLEYQYAWKPTLMDLHATAEVLSVKMSQGIPIYVSDRVTERKTASLNTGNPGQRVFVRMDQTISYRGKARFVVKSGSKTLAQLGVTNPALVAWELIPYSFVVDWLLPVGDYLSALDALVGTSNLVVVRGVLEDVKYSADGYAGFGRQDILRKTRYAPTSSLALPKLALHDTSRALLTQLANGLALLRQLRR